MELYTVVVDTMSPEQEKNLDLKSFLKLEDAQAYLVQQADEAKTHLIDPGPEDWDIYCDTDGEFAACNTIGAPLRYWALINIFHQAV